MSKALDGVRILDFTHVQSGPTCTQLLAWMGADVIKVEKAGEGDVTRGQLRDIPDVDSLYFTMLNHNKRSITLDTKTREGMVVLDRLIKHCDVLVVGGGGSGLACSSQGIDQGSAGAGSGQGLRQAGGHGGQGIGQPAEHGGKAATGCPQAGGQGVGHGGH